MELAGDSGDGRQVEAQKLRHAARLARASQIVRIQETHGRVEDAEMMARMELEGKARYLNHSGVAGSGGLLTMIPQSVLEASVHTPQESVATDMGARGRRNATATVCRTTRW